MIQIHIAAKIAFASSALKCMNKKATILKSQDQYMIGGHEWRIRENLVYLTNLNIDVMV